MTDATVPAPDLEAFLGALKVKQQAAWASGDYAVVGNTIPLMAELLCEAMDVRSGWKVLDVAGGNGNATLAAARRGCEVTSTDYVPSLLEAGRRRVDSEGWKVAFQEADAENLPFAEHSFDAAISTVGVMFAPNQERAAAELFRVVRPGGKIGLANWTPAGFVGQMFKVLGKYLPPAAGVKPPSLWGTEARLKELFPAAAGIEVTARHFNFRSHSPERWLQGFRKFYGPMHKAFGALDEAGQTGLATDLLALVASLNRAQDGTMVVPSEYLEVVISR
jgi:ubiquinone/menaquinone biosynthesis C-methylase UbiE